MAPRSRYPTRANTCHDHATRDCAPRQTSLKTVSRVINRDPLVNAKTRARIEAIIAEIGYEPSQAARMMRSQKSNVVGFVADGVATSGPSIDLIRGAQDVAWEHGKQMMLFNIERGAPSQQLAEAQLAAFRAEAVIYATVYHQPVELPPTTITRVLLNCFDPRGTEHAIVPDDYQLAETLMHEVLDRGYQRPVFLNLNRGIVAAGLRAAGIRDAAKKRGIDMTDQPHGLRLGGSGARSAGMGLASPDLEVMERTLKGEHPSPGSMDDEDQGLIAEDEPLIALTLEELLESMGFEILGPYGNATAALGHAIDERPDLALVNLRLRHDSAFPLLDHLNRQGIPMIIVSGIPSPRQGRLFNAVWVTKPFDEAALRRIINEALRAGRIPPPRPTGPISGHQAA